MEHILASIYDTTAWANYQRGRGKGRKPQRHPRPGDAGPLRFGKAMPKNELIARLERDTGVRRAS